MANRIAEAFIELKVRGQEKVKATLGGVTNAAKKMGDGFDDALGRIGERFDSATEGARKLQGAIAGVLGIVTVVAAAFFKLGNSIYELSQQMRPARERVKEFAEEVRASGGSAADQANKVRERLAELNEEAAKLDGKVLRLGLESGDTKRMRVLKEIVELNKELEGFNQREREAIEVRNRRESEGLRESARLRRESLEVARAELEAQLASGPEESARIMAEQERVRIARELQSIQQQYGDALNVEESVRGDLLQTLQDEFDLAVRISELRLQAIDREKKERLQAIADAAAAEERAAQEAQRRAEEDARKERERARETARIIAESNAQAASETRQALLDAVSSINSDRGAFSQLEGLIGSIVDDVKQIRGRI